MNIDFREKGVNGIVWTASDFTPNIINELPYIELVEYEQTFSATLANIKYWETRLSSVFSNRPSDPYKGLYMGRPTGNTYILPFFSDEHHNINQGWDPNQGPLGPWAQKAFTVAENIGKILTPAAGIIYPKSYSGAAEYGYTVTFYLLNTVGDTEQTIQKNRNFLEVFIAQNLHAQHNPLTITPPCLYEVYIPGVRWSPVAVVSRLSVKNIGTLNTIQTGPPLFGPYIVPDAWEITIELKELINESRALYNEAIMGKTSGGQMTIKVINS